MSLADAATNGATRQRLARIEVVAHRGELANIFGRDHGTCSGTLEFNVQRVRYANELDSATLQLRIVVSRDLKRSSVFNLATC